MLLLNICILSVYISNRLALTQKVLVGSVLPGRVVVIDVQEGDVHL